MIWSAWAIPVLVLGEFAMLAVVPVAVLTVAVFRNARLRALRWWAAAVAATYGSGLAAWALGPDRAPSLSKDLHPVHAAVIVAVAVAFAITSGCELQNRRIVGSRTAGLRTPDPTARGGRRSNRLIARRA